MRKPNKEKKKYAMKWMKNKKQPKRKARNKFVSQSRDGSCHVNYDIKRNDDGMLLSGPLLQIN